jgi:hypothetical protein
VRFRVGRARAVHVEKQRKKRAEWIVHIEYLYEPLLLGVFEGY